MKGIVFTEFLQLVEEKFGYETVDKILLIAQPPNDGAYTAVGTYDHSELISMVGALSGETGVDVPALVKAFGRYLFKKFAVNYGEKIEGYRSSFELLEDVEGYIHVEVRKLYPDAELPTFKCCRLDDRTLTMAYSSTRPFADLCEGLIEQCVEHFSEDMSISRNDLSLNGTAAEFTLQLQAVSV